MPKIVRHPSELSLYRPWKDPLGKSWVTVGREPKPSGVQAVTDPAGWKDWDARVAESVSQAAPLVQALRGIGLEVEAECDLPIFGHDFGTLTGPDEAAWSVASLVEHRLLERLGSDAVYVQNGLAGAIEVLKRRGFSGPFAVATPEVTPSSERLLLEYVDFVFPSHHLTEWIGVFQATPSLIQVAMGFDFCPIQTDDRLYVLCSMDFRVVPSGVVRMKVL